jgi:hypothetical protein
MKKLILLFNFISLLNYAPAQTISLTKVAKDNQWLGLKFTAQSNGLAKGGFDALNAELEKNKINTLPDYLVMQGLSLNVWANQRTGFEFAIHFITSKLDETDKFINSGIPYLSGYHFKFACFTDIFKTKRFRIVASAGMSLNFLEFDIVDLQPQSNTFGNLLTNPALSRTLAFESRGMWGLEGSLGFDYQLFKRGKSELTIGMMGGYNYQPLKKFVKWTTKRTTIPVASFPAVNLDSYFIQLNMAFNFSL